MEVGVRKLSKKCHVLLFNAPLYDEKTDIYDKSN